MEVFRHHPIGRKQQFTFEEITLICGCSRELVIREECPGLPFFATQGMNSARRRGIYRYPSWVPLHYIP